MKLFLSILFISFTMAYGQELQTTALAGSSSLPFWMSHNQLGRFNSSAKVQSLTEALVSDTMKVPGKLTLSYGSDLALLVSSNGVDPKIIEAWVGLSGKIIRLQGGAFADPEVMDGLSVSNGDLLRSRNARPYPKVKLSTPGFIPFLVGKKWLRFSAEYDEGILYGKRVDDQPHLHHKSLMFQVLASPSLRFSMGLNHFVFWGGTSPTLGKLPQSLDDYVGYVIGRAGNNNYRITEQQNVAGNHLGDYLFTMEKDFTSYRMRLQLSHPFDDGSGMGFENLRDNLYTLYLAKKQRGSLIDALVIEYMYTKHQSGDQRDEANIPKDHRRGIDDYFNHGIYQSGFTYLEQCIGTPLFEPLAYDNGTVAGVANNRVSALHLGAKGCLSQVLTWQAVVTLSNNYGTYYHPFPAMRRQLYSLARLEWKSPRYPLTLGAMIGWDAGELMSENVGGGGVVRWSF